MQGVNGTSPAPRTTNRAQSRTSSGHSWPSPTAAELLNNTSADEEAKPLHNASGSSAGTPLRGMRWLMRDCPRAVSEKSQRAASAVSPCHLLGFIAFSVCVLFALFALVQLHDLRTMTAQTSASLASIAQTHARFEAHTVATSAVVSAIASDSKNASQAAIAAAAVARVQSGAAARLSALISEKHARDPMIDNAMAEFEQLDSNPPPAEDGSLSSLIRERNSLLGKLDSLLHRIDHESEKSLEKEKSGFPLFLPADAKRPRLLVIYVFSNNDPHYLGNLKYFVQTAVRAHQEIDYVFVLNQDVPKNSSRWNPSKEPWVANAYVDREFLPPLTPNAIYVDHPNECFDLGTVGWFLETADYARAVRENGGTPPDYLKPPSHWDNETYAHVQTDTRRYGYFFLINASVRGPVLPSYFNLEATDQYWYYPFLRMMELDPEMKLVGCTASCNFSPHIQSYALFTDAIGMGLIRDGPSLHCTNSFHKAIFDGEIGTSWQILQAGYNIGSMIPAQQNVEWRGQGLHSQHCSSGVDLADQSRNTALNPYDLVFHKNQLRRAKVVGGDDLVKWQAEIAQRRLDRTANLGKMQAASKEVREEWNTRRQGWKF